MKKFKSVMYVCWVIFMTFFGVIGIFASDGNNLGAIAGAIMLSVVGIVEFVLRK